MVGELISKPYIHITLELLARFGIAVKNDSWQRFVIPAGSRYQSPGAIHVEADASSASYFIALGAIATGAADEADADNAAEPKSIRILGVGQDSIQGDIRFIEAAQAMGAQVESGPNWLQVSRGSWPLKAIDLDCNHIPDAAMTLGVMALYADGVTTLRNIASWRVKETDRIAAMAIELRKLGATVEEGPDYIRITPPGYNPSDAGPPQVASAPRGSAVHAVTSVGPKHTGRPPAFTLTTIASPCAFRWPLSIRPNCPCASKTQSAWPRPSPTISRRCSRSARPSANISP